jgi:hypothetical protein
MAPIKFEENIKEKLEQRSIQPSSNAWQSLEQKLNADDKKRIKNKFWWFGVAASVIGLLFIIQQFVGIDNTNQAIPAIIVESERDTFNNPKESPIVVKETKQAAPKRPEVINVNRKPHTDVSYKTVNNNRKTKQKTPIKAPVTAKNEEKPKALKAAKITEVDVTASIANVADSLNNSDTQITAIESSGTEVEVLLNAATKDVQLSDINKTMNTVSIDANALLEDVETELPPSMRGQLFKVIEKNFKTVKTAVVTRNK